jgi:hypothetical protein
VSAVAQALAALTDDDQAVLDRVESSLADGRVLKRWWDETYARNSFAQRFELTRAFNRAEESFGFFDEVRLAGGPLPVMGNYQEMFYDQPRSPARGLAAAAEWMRAQVREFVLHYFMRVSDLRAPKSFVADDAPPRSPFLGGLTLCPGADVTRAGFGFTQVFYKERGTGAIGRFSEDEEYAIVDLRELGRLYDWIVVKVQILDFRFAFKPFGPDGLELGLPLREESYLVLASDFILDQGQTPGRLGEYGLGYAFIKSGTEGLLAYGPGEFTAAIELIHFRVSDSGEVRVGMAFVADRPARIANVSADPIEWGIRVADLFSLGLASRLFEPLAGALTPRGLRARTFDPVYGFVSVANALTGNAAAERFCLSREQIEKDFLVRHFLQHYQTIVGSLLTWRQVPDWLDAGAIPDWIVRGTSS